MPYKELVCLKRCIRRHFYIKGSLHTNFLTSCIVLICRKFMSRCAYVSLSFHESFIPFCSNVNYIAPSLHQYSDHFVLPQFAPFSFGYVNFYLLFRPLTKFFLRSMLSPFLILYYTFSPFFYSVPKALFYLLQLFFSGVPIFLSVTVYNICYG